MAKAKKPITKRQRSMIIAGAVLLAAVLVVAILAIIPGGNTEEESSSESSAPELITLVSSTADNVKEVRIENDNGGYTAVVEPETVDGETTYMLSVTELGDIQAINSTNLTSLSTRLTSIKATQLITEDAGRKSEFGFDAPQATVKYSFRDGTGATIYIGADAPDSAGYYVMFEDKIYLAQTNMCTLFLQDYKFFVDMALTPEVDLEQYAVTFAGFTLGGTMRPDEIKVSYDKDAVARSEYILVSSSYRMTCGELEKSVRSSIVDNYFNTVLNLTAAEVMAVEPTDAELKKYGLDEPYSVVGFSIYSDEAMTETVDYTLKISEPKDGSCYIMHDDVDVIYRMDFVEKTMLDITFNEMVDNISILPYITKVEQIVYRTPEKEYVFDLEHFTNDEGKEDINVTCGGKTLITDYFRTFYGTTIGITGDEYLDAEDVPDISTLGEPILEIIYKYTGDVKEDDIVQVYEGPTRRSYVAYNGKIEFLSKTTKVTLSMKNCEKVLNDQETSY